MRIFHDMRIETKVRGMDPEQYVKYRPRYVSYARSLGLGPEEALELDSKRYPGGKMTGFMLWVQNRWKEWDLAHGHRRDHVRNDQEHLEFTLWLETRVDHLRIEVRQQAINSVDQRHGYTMEHAPDPIQHMLEYDKVEIELLQK
jgi:hypothetical protein